MSDKPEGNDSVSPAILISGGWARFVLTVYGPSGLSWLGFGVVTPLIAFSALELGASVPMSAFITGLTAAATAIGDLPASWISTRLGEKRAIIISCFWDALWLGVAFIAPNLFTFGMAVFFFGLSGAVFGLARYGYIIDASAEHVRGRLFATLGGVQRIGYFVGPLAAAAAVAAWNLSAAYALAAIICLFAAAVTLLLPDLPPEVVARRKTDDQEKIWPVLRKNVRVYAVVGTSATMLLIMRAARTTILPLWCASLGMDGSLASLVYAVSMGVDMSLFFVSGAIMDRFGRKFVAVPCLILLGIGLAGLALAHDLAMVIVMAVILGIGDGISVGINLTLGSDAAPEVGRTQFLAGWRLVGDSGGLFGPLAISGLTVIGGLATATVMLGAISCFGAVWINYGINWLARRQPTATDNN